MPSFVVTIVWHHDFTPGRTVAEALASHFEGVEDELTSSGLAIPTRIRCEGEEPRVPESPPLAIPTGENIVNIVLLLVEADLIHAFANGWSSFANDIHREANDHSERMLVLPIQLGDRSAIPPFKGIQSIATSLFPGSGPSDPKWMRRLVLTVVAHLGNFLRRLEQFEKDPSTPIDETLLNRFPLFLSHAKRDGMAVVTAIRDHLTNNDYGVDTFIDAKDLPAGLGYEKQFSAAIRAGAVVSIRTDAYSSRPWCRWENLEGKRLQRPIVVLDLLRDSEVRVNPYGGNVPALRIADPTMKADDSARDFDRAILLIMTEVVRVLLWNRRVKALKGLAAGKYPGRMLIAFARAPELVDIANLRRDENGPVTILHPGPPLSRIEGELIAAVAGDLKLCAPSDLGVTL